MFSLLYFSAFFVGSLLLSAWAVTFAAGRAGSGRARFRAGLLASLLIGIINLVLLAVGWVLHTDKAAGDVLYALAGLVMNIVVVYAVLKYTFGLSAGRTLVPFGAFLFVNLAVAAVLYGVVRPHVWEAYTTSAISMAPTIEKGDRFSVNKLATPRRWDLVAYRNDRQGGVLYCKRVAGLPGERIRFEGGSLFVNEQRVAAPHVLEGRLRMTLPGVGVPERYQDGETVSLGPDDYFVVGDNLDKSADSRIDGPVGRDAMVGVVDLIYWPPRKVAILR
jgi:signal peptidase I